MRLLTNDCAANERLAMLLAVNARDEERRQILKREKATIVQALGELNAVI